MDAGNGQRQGFDRSEMAGAVASAAHGAGDGGVDGPDPNAAATQAAAAVVDAAIDAVRECVRPPGASDGRVPAAALLEFLQHTRRGLLTAREIAEEATLWQRLVGAAWPDEAAEAVDLLAAVPPGPESAPALLAMEPANDLEHAVAAVHGDPGARPALWQAIHDGRVVLPVLAFELVRPEGAHFRFLSAPGDHGPVVFGFTTKERFEAVRPEGAEMSHIVAPGSALPRFWPAGHWLALNPGYAVTAVVSPWEITGLPHGAGMALPLPDAVGIRAPDPDDHRSVLLEDAIRATPDVERVWWAQVRGRAEDDGGTWRDVVVVAAAPPAQETTAIHALTAAPTAGMLSEMLVVGRHADLGHPFVDAVVSTGRGLPRSSPGSSP